MAPLSLTTDMLLVFGVIAAVVFLFVVEWVRVDLVAILTMVALPMLGLVDGREAFGGFGSTAVISIIAVIILGRGLDHTGVISRGVRPLLRLAGSSHWRIVTILSVTIAVISSIMQNIGAAALFLPALRRISRDTGLSLSQLMMPVGAAAILGGTVTLVGSSPLIMLNDLMAQNDLPPFSLFSVTPMGLILVCTGIGYFLVAGKYLLPRDGREDAAPPEEPSGPIHYYSEIGDLFELSLPGGASPGITVSRLSDDFLVHTVALATRDSKTNLIPPDRDKLIPPDSVIAVYGPRQMVEKASDIFGFQLQEGLQEFKDKLSRDLAGVVEVIVPPRSKFIGHSIDDIHFQHNYLVTPLALFREDKTHYKKIGGRVLKAGDAILMHGAWERFRNIHQTRDLMFSHPLDSEILQPHKAGMAMACFVLATALVIFTNLSLAVSLMAGALAMMLSRVLTIDEAYKGVDWRTVFLLAGLIPLGLATHKTGAATWLSQQILSWLHQPPPFLMLLLIGALSTVFTLVVSNVGATVLLVPLVISLAEGSGIDPRLAALMVGLAASNSFMLPTHQVNALYMGPGRYRSLDYLKVGTPLSVLFLLVLTLVLYLFY